MYAGSVPPSRLSRGPAAAIQPNSWNRRTPDAYLRDLSRDGRLIQIGIWYPAQLSNDATPLSFRTYVDAYSSPLESAARGLTAAEKREMESKYSRTTFPNAAAGIVERLLNTKTAAYPDTTPARRRYPVILFAAGGGGHR